MGNPSTTHDRADRERERERRSSLHHHHHRTISSTTLLLALSLILAVLAITLSIPSYNNPAAAVAAHAPPAEGTGVLGFLTPRRAQGIVARESAVARREFEVAQREAELLNGVPVGIPIPPPPPPPTATIAVVTQTVTVELIPPTSTIVKEIVKEIEAVAPPPPTPPSWWKDPRLENLLEREKRISEREKEVGGREETVGKRENDAAKREGWIMEQLINIGNDKVVEEEVVYETPGRRRPKVPPRSH